MEYFRMILDNYYSYYISKFELEINNINNIIYKENGFLKINLFRKF